MHFVVKDLLISVLPEKIDLGKFASCGACTSDSSGPPCSGACPGSRDPITAIKETIFLADNPVTLAYLRQQLQEQLAVVEKRTLDMAKTAKPLSGADVTMLRAHLGTALQELDAKPKTK
jgi:hypothetical protein